MNCKIFQKTFELILLFELKVDDNQKDFPGLTSNLTIQLSKLISLLIIHEIDNSSVFLVLTMILERSQNYSEFLNFDVLVWIRSIPISIGGIIVKTI